MSSTNRSNAREDHIADYYFTPLKDVEMFLDSVIETNNCISEKLKNGIIVDCCAGGNEELKEGGGVLECYHPMTYPTVIKNMFGADVETYDIRKDSLAKIKCNYLNENLCYKPDIIITNPPFNLATEIIEKSIDDIKDDGYVIMLLRLNFFGSKKREEFFKKYMPESVYVHHIRIGFTDKKDANGFVCFDNDGNPKRGSTDSIEYAHFIWNKNNLHPKYTKLYYV